MSESASGPSPLTGFQIEVAQAFFGLDQAAGFLLAGGRPLLRRD